MNKFQSLGTRVPSTPSILCETAPGQGCDPVAQRLLCTTLSSVFPAGVVQAPCLSKLPHSTPRTSQGCCSSFFRKQHGLTWAKL